MSLKKTIRSRVLQLVLSDTGIALRRTSAALKRRLTGKSHELQMFLQLDDPYSYLLASFIPTLQKHFNVQVNVHLVEAPEEGFKPQPQMLGEYAIYDCRLLARELGVPFLDKGAAPAVEHRRALLQLLASEHDEPHFVDALIKSLSAYWRGDSESIARQIDGIAMDGKALPILEKNRALLLQLGHYSSATIFYEGEWYWGIDRLLYLTDRLEQQGLSGADGEERNRDIDHLRRTTRLNLPASVPACSSELPPLELFFSFRSPYSYLVLQSAERISNAFGMTLKIRPVLPMVMRGLPVPTAKLRYIVFDANREAHRLGIPFGLIGDPVGPAAERCIAIACHAERQGKAFAFISAAATAIWSEGRDLAQDKPLRRVVERAGLDWEAARVALQDDGWRLEAKKNRDDLAQVGLWGVPSWKLGDLALWGRDRDWLVERAIEELCDKGEGIIV